MPGRSSKKWGGSSEDRRPEREDEGIAYQKLSDTAA